MTKVWFLGVIFAIINSLVSVSGQCDTFSSACALALGQALPYTTGSTFIKLVPSGSYFISFSMPLDTTSVHIDLSLLFGSAQMFAAVNRQPSLTDFDFTNSLSGDQDYLSIISPNHLAADKFHVLIRASPSSPAYFTGVLATAVQPLLQLAVNGMPQTTRMGSGSTTKFRFTVTSTAPVNVVATPYSAHLPAMTMFYYPTSNSQPTALPDAYFNANNDPAEGFLSFTPKATDVGKNFLVNMQAGNMSYFSVAVRAGITPTGVTITGTPAQDPPVIGAPTHTLVLLNGQPQRDRVGQQDERYYVFYVPAGVTGAITISVDPIQGDSDLYVNPSARGIFHHEGNDPFPVWTSMRSNGMDSVTIQSSDRNAVINGGAYYITVFGYDAAEFMVRVTVENTATALVEGYTIQDAVPARTYKYYSFHDTDPTASVYFDLLPTSGDADLFIGCTFVPTGTDAGYPSQLTQHNSFASTMYLEDTIVVSPADPKSCSLGAQGDDSAHRGQGGIFYLAVYGASDIGSTFMLSAQHSHGERVLTGGFPITGIVYRGTTQRYKVKAGFQAEELRIMLTPAYGDADLYVKLQSPPQLNDFHYKSNNFNTIEDTVTIGESAMCADCWVYVMVYGFSTTEYSIVASFDDGTVTLSNGVPQRGSVAANSIEYYNYRASSACSITVVATVSSGNIPSMFLSKSVERPNATTADTISRLSTSGQGVLPKVVLTSVSVGQDLHIGVGGAGHNVTYTIRVFETSIDTTQPPTLLTLPDGVPQEDEISNTDKSWLYYQVSAPIGHEALNLRLVKGVGIVDMSVARCPPGVSTYQCAVHHLPNATNTLDTTADTDRTSIKIYRNDPAPTTYIVGVHSLAYYSAFQISAAFQESTLDLQAGVPVMDHVNKGEKDYFSFYLDQSFVSVSFALTTLSGDPDIYVSTTVGHPAPDSVNSTWRSSDYGPDVLVINPRTDPKACYHCMYYIAVIGNLESTYTISVTTSNNMPRLIDGVPSRGYAQLNKWTYYSFHNAYGSGRDLHVNLVSATGNADLYITLDGTIPIFGHYAYISEDYFTNDGVDILHTDAAYAPCRGATTPSGAAGPTNCVVIVGVYGFSASEYTVTLTSSSAATLLQLGSVRTDSVTMSQYKYFRTLVSQSNGLEPYTLRFAVTPTAGHVQLFVSCDNMQPNSTDYMWKLTPDTNSIYLDVLSLSAVDKGCLRSGSQYYASVYGETASTFTITASVLGASNVPMLVPNQAHAAQVAFQHLDYYFVRPGADYNNVRLLATVTQGDVDIYVSMSWATRPTIDANTGEVKSYVLSSAKSGDEDMTIDHRWIQKACEKADNCYFIVAVVGAMTSSSYSIMTSTPDATLQLTAGVPRQSHVDSGKLEYFKFSITQPELDVVISVTPINGDPDMFISMAPVRHPTRDNNTWFQSKFGADSITLQYRDTAKHCVPNPNVAGKHCDVYIGVFGWMNTTFTILANVDEGFRSPVLLLDQSPQTGLVDTAHYTYYKYSVSVPRSNGAATPAVDIKFTLTPTDDGDADLFLLIEPKGNHTQPGVSNYDYRSVGWGSVTEMIELSADMPHYCFDCTVYLAVYGYRRCAYTIQASSSGLVSVQAGQAMGGHVSAEKFAYYSVHNANQFGNMKFTLTMISEDADLYITAHKPNTRLSLPTNTNYMWRSLYVGSDVISFDYTDSRFCTDCDYIIGVYGYSNATFTLMVTDQEDGIIKLAQNRPQIASIAARNGVLFFSVVISSSQADMTVSLTSLDTGYADMYVQVYDATVFKSAAGGDSYVLPDPNVPSSYKYTTHGTEDDHVFIPGPHPKESLLVVAVKAASTVRFSIVATSSQSPVLILAGVPQSHYVESGVNEYFKFYPHADEDLHITLTARSGDPDMFVSTEYMKPHCTKSTDPYSSFAPCSNYTWASRNYMTDQIIISRDSPCTAVMPGTMIGPDCDPAKAYNPASGSPVYIGIYGYSAAQFTLLVAPVGQQVQLLAGQPQLSRTSPSFICNTRNPTTGACTTPAYSNTKVEVAYFAFRIAAPRNQQHAVQGNAFTAPLQSVFDVILSIVPQCNATLADAEICSPGCDCAPLKVYVNSCPLSKCTQIDRKPSALVGQHKAMQTIKQGSGSTIFLSAASYSTSKTTTFCDPTVIGEDCGYYVAVVASPLPVTSKSPVAKLESAAFTITARTPGDVILIPCSNDVYPDGVQFHGEDTIYSTRGQVQSGSGGHHYYELCSLQYTENSVTPRPSAESLIVELEQCAGTTKLYACADTNNCEHVLPSTHSWGYFADETQTCVHSWDPRITRDTCVSAVHRRPTITLPQRVGNYFLMTNGTGKFELRVQSTVNGQRAAPTVTFAGRQSAESGLLEVQKVTGNTVSLQWQQARVLMPGALNPMDARLMTYTAYVFDLTATNTALKTLETKQGVENVRLTSACGLSYASEVLPSKAIKVVPILLKTTEQGTAFMSQTFEGLTISTKYRIVVVASCDSNCLRQLSKVNNDPRVTVSCSDSSGDCKPQNMVYLTQDITTADIADKNTPHDTDDTSNSSDGWVQGLLNFSFAVMIILIIVAIGIAAYFLKNNWQETQDWVIATWNGTGGVRSNDWAGSDSEHGDDSAANARSTHGLTHSSSAPASGGLFGFSSLPQVGSSVSKMVGSGSRKGKDGQDGVELENFKYSPPSAAASEIRAKAYDPIDFRGDAASGAAGHLGEVIGSTASKLYGAASNALSSVPSIDAWNPLHPQSAPSAPTTGRAGATVGYSPVTAQAAAPTHTINDVDDELTL
eukprot:CAMPEP_0184975878 /NCGR_PEP_ID=MMETSP1098-20130426/6959_1 /TAXON_ID=89044 /ORGANISM="Spumella elongata, Strain CCAP 955/1" /LENGTH=2755 /DNA_ID=CAMNT_0027498653 /DNA_START=79 /DNA_END=8346 /DNA_ORIENTATION=+